jgi:hypothetical protein
MSSMGMTAMVGGEIPARELAGGERKGVGKYEGGEGYL